MFCDCLINYSTYCPAVNVCSHQHQSFVQVPADRRQSARSGHFDLALSAKTRAIRSSHCVGGRQRDGRINFPD